MAARGRAVLCAMAFGALLAGLAGPCRAQAPDVASAAPAAQAAAFDDALRAYERSQWPQAYEALSRLGDAGHARAARMALDMWRFGPRLYGTAFAASDAQLVRWVRLQD